MAESPHRKKFRFNKGGAASLAAARPFSHPRASPSMSQNAMPNLPKEETKYVDGYKSQTALQVFPNATNGSWFATVLNPQNTGGGIGCMPVPKTGTDYSDRDGRKIFMKKVRIRGVIQFTAKVANVIPHLFPVVRIVVVKDTRTNGVELKGEDVIGPGQGGNGLPSVSGNGGAIHLFTNPEGWGRYKIVHDEFYIGDPGGMTTAGVVDFSAVSMQYPFSITINCDCDVNFSNTTGDVSAVVDNSYHMLAGVTESSSLSVAVGYYARTSFIG